MVSIFRNRYKIVIFNNVPAKFSIIISNHQADIQIGSKKIVKVPMVIALQMTRDTFRNNMPFYHRSIIDIMDSGDFYQLTGGCLALNVVTVQKIQPDNNGYVKRGAPQIKRVFECGNRYARQDKKRA